MPLDKSSVVSCLLINKGKNMSSTFKWVPSHISSLQKKAPTSWGSGKQHKNSARADSFGYMMRYTNMKFRLLFSVMNHTRASSLATKEWKWGLCWTYREVLLTYSCTVLRTSNWAWIFRTQTLSSVLLEEVTEKLDTLLTCLKEMQRYSIVAATILSI